MNSVFVETSRYLEDQILFTLGDYDIVQLTFNSMYTLQSTLHAQFSKLKNFNSLDQDRNYTVLQCG